MTLPYEVERLGAVRMFGLQRIFELDSGAADLEDGDSLSWGTTVCRVPAPALSSVHRRMAVVVPCKNERLRLLEGVLMGIPHECLVVVVSNSDREPVDRFAMERDVVERFSRYNQRPAVIVHQRDVGVGEVMTAAGMASLTDDDGLIRNGKGEGMLLGLVVAALEDRAFVGFVDADNYVPGSVTEYVNAFAADFHLAESPYAMVRVNWRSKPKVVDGALMFSKWGRVSETTNRYLNLLLSHKSGFGTEAIRTGNAGEHALTIQLALSLEFASGFAVEPQELIEVLDRFGTEQVASTSADIGIIREGVEIYQIETLNPHFHEDKGEDHVDAMRHSSLGVVYHSPACPNWLRREIESDLVREGVPDLGVALAPPRVYPPLGSLDWDVARDRFVVTAKTYERFAPAP